MSQTLQNQYFETNISVNTNTEAAVKAEMIATYKSLQQSVSMNKEDMNMSFDPKPVTLEEYNQSLMESITAYYEHAVNNSVMSKEEAIQSTAEMSENYFSAVEEFQDAQDNTIVNTDAVVPDGVTVDTENTVDTGTEDGVESSGGIDF